MSDRVRLRWLDELPFDEMKREVATLPANSVVLYTIVHEDVTGVTLEQDEALLGLRSVANAPVFSCYESELGSGIIGGRLFPDRTLGIDGWSAAVRILQGEPPVQVLSTSARIMAPGMTGGSFNAGASARAFSRREARSFSVRRLWDQYHRYVVAAVALLSLQTLLIAALLIYRHRRASSRGCAGPERATGFISLPIRCPRLIGQVDRDQRYQFVNRAYEHQFGLEPSQTIGRSPSAKSWARRAIGMFARMLSGHSLARKSLSPRSSAREENPPWWRRPTFPTVRNGETCGDLCTRAGRHGSQPCPAGGQPAWRTATAKTESR